MDKLIPVEIEAATELCSVPIEQFTEFEAAYEMTGGIVPTGTKQINITSNGTTTEDVTNYADAEITVNVQGGITPTGTKQISITSNGTTTEDVTNYAAAEITVNVSGGVTPTGTKEIEVDSAGMITEDVTNYASVEVTVPSGSASTPNTSITANPSISVSSSGLITASASASQSVTPTVSEGWVSSGSAGTISVSGSNTSQLSTQGATTITPSTSQQTAVASGKYTTGNIVVDPIPSQYIVPSGSQTITQNGTVDVTALAEVVVNVSGSGYDCDSGTFTPSSNETTHTFTVSKQRNNIAIWTDSIIQTSNAVDWLFGTYVFGSRSGAYGYTNTSNTLTVQSGLSTSSSFGSSSLKIGAGNSSRTFTSGVTYHWLAW